jgi:flavin reductase (DIM6/NTAB) family NADH-FMN oxidoreductase RutF
MAGAGHDFNEIVATFDAPMFVVTAFDGNQRDGCLVGFGTQCSIHPPRFLACLSNKNRTTRIAMNCDRLVVHALRADQHVFAQLFGGETADEIDKLAQVAWHDGPDGVPVIAGCDWFSGRVIARHDDLGDHIGFVLAIDAAECLGRGARLSLRSVRDVDAGHAP